MRLFLSLCFATLFLFGGQVADANAGDYGYRSHGNYGYSGSRSYRSTERTYYRPPAAYSNRYQVRPAYGYGNRYVAPSRSYYPSYRRSCGGYGGY